MRNKGFSVVEVLIVLVVVGIVATLGVVGYNRWKQVEAAKGNSSDTSQQTAVSAPEVKQTSDLDKATSTLDQTDFGDADATDLDTQSSAF